MHICSVCCPTESLHQHAPWAAGCCGCVLTKAWQLPSIVQGFMHIAAAMSTSQAQDRTRANLGRKRACAAGLQGLPVKKGCSRRACMAATSCPAPAAQSRVMCVVEISNEYHWD